MRDCKAAMAIVVMGPSLGVGCLVVWGMRILSALWRGLHVVEKAGNGEASVKPSSI